MEGPHKQDRGGPAGTESDPRREVSKETGPPSCSSWGQNPAADPTCGGGIPPRAPAPARKGPPRPSTEAGEPACAADPRHREPLARWCWEALSPWAPTIQPRVDRAGVVFPQTSVSRFPQDLASVPPKGERQTDRRKGGHFGEVVRLPASLPPLEFRSSLGSRVPCLDPHPKRRGGTPEQWGSPQPTRRRSSGWSASAVPALSQVRPPWPPASAPGSGRLVVVQGGWAVPRRAPGAVHPHTSLPQAPVISSGF